MQQLAQRLSVSAELLGAGALRGGFSPGVAASCNCSANLSTKI